MTYKTPQALKAAVYERLSGLSKERGLPLQRLQLRFLIERFLIRVLHAFPQAIVKGGVAIELRLENARTTRDLDLGLRQVSADQALAELQRVCREPLEDWITFEVQPDTHYPVLQAAGMAYEGHRLKVSARLAGKPLFSSFGLDLAFGEASQPAESLTLQPLISLGSNSTEPLIIPVYALESHIAEKLHAYTLPRETPNSRIKDFPDLAILASARPISGESLRSALEQTFGHRDTHPLPSNVPTPPEDWTPRYLALAKENQLPWPDLSSLHEKVALFLDPALQSDIRNSTWSPTSWSWTPL